MRQIFHEGNVLRLEIHAHLAIVGQADHVARVTTEVVVEAIRRSGPRTFNDRHTFGTVSPVGVITRSIPEQDAGGEVIHLVFAEDGGKPTGTLNIKAPDRAHVSATVSGVKSKTERIEVSQFGSDANPPSVAVTIKINTLQHRTINTSGEQAIDNARVLIVSSVREAITAKRAIHGPRGHLHAVEGHGNSQAHEVHSVTGRIAAILAGIVVLSAEPEEAGAHVFGKLAGDGDTSAVSGTAAEDGVVGNEAGKAEVLETHTNLGVGLGDHPVNVAVTDLDDLAVSTERSAILRATPVLVAHFEEQNALQGFRGDDVDLGTQTLFGGKLVAVLFEQVIVTQLPSKRPVALGLDISSLRTSSSAEHEAGSKKQSHDALHVYSFLLK